MLVLYYIDGGEMLLENIKGVGEKTAKLLTKLKLDTAEAVLYHYPVGYSIYEKPCPVSEIDNRLTVSIKARVIRVNAIKNVKNLKVITALLKDEEGSVLSAIWFNMPFLANTLKAGGIYIFRGRTRDKNKGMMSGELCLQQPEIFTIDAYDKKTNEMQPVYKRTEGLTNNNLIKIIHQLIDVHLDKDIVLEDILPIEIQERYKLVDYKTAIKNIHFPVEQKDYIDARNRLVFEEFLVFTLSLRALKASDNCMKNKRKIEHHYKTQCFINNLPYKLTEPQLKVLKEINDDMSGDKTMNRLIQGDVGCGKTIVALIALMNTCFAGYQGALMAPTEVLARQHYLNILEMFELYGIPLNPVLLIGSMTAKEKKEIRETIETGKADIIIGTHAIIQEGVRYSNLGLVVTDEQHRFGVKQREKLSQKGDEPHILVMSATPIPRTLAIILYGDLDISIIDSLPSNRLPIKNCVVGKEYREKAYKFILKEIEKGHQAYVICPMVDESEMMDTTDVVSYSALLREKLPHYVNIEYLHGKMSASAKNQIMEDFNNGKIHVLVSTTVIEVGVNVPNATVMMIENAERFGLAALHQIRGRVGRGSDRSYCMFICTSDKKEAIDKLKILEQSNDGFLIASEDLKMRGPGDLFGIKQSGEMEFKLGDIYTDAKILKWAAEEAQNISLNSGLAQYNRINQRVEEVLGKYIKHINI